MRLVSMWNKLPACALVLLALVALNARAGEGCALDKEPQAEVETVAPVTVPTSGIEW